MTPFSIKLVVLILSVYKEPKLGLVKIVDIQHVYLVSLKKNHNKPVFILYMTISSLTFLCDAVVIVFI